MNDLDKLSRSEEWFERLADITECPPDYLRERFMNAAFFRLTPREAKTRAKNNWSYKGSYPSAVFFVQPVPQKESGVLRIIE